MTGNAQGTAGAGVAEGGEAALLLGVWREIEPAAGNAAQPRPSPDAAPSETRVAEQAVAEQAVAEQAVARAGHERLLQSARAVHALNERLQLDMDVPEHRLARDRLTAYVAKVSALSGVRADELVIGSGSDAFVVQNDASGRTIAKFDTQDAVQASVGDSLDQLAAAARAERVAGEPSLDPPQQPQRASLLP